MPTPGKGPYLEGDCLQDLDHGGLRRLVYLLQARRHLPGHGVDALCAGSVFAQRRDRLPGVAADPDLRVNFNFAQEGHTEKLRHALPLPVAEEVNLTLAVRAG